MDFGVKFNNLLAVDVSYGTEAHLSRVDFPHDANCVC